MSQSDYDLIVNDKLTAHRHRRHPSLAFRSRNRYVAVMPCDVACRIAAILVALNLAFGPAGVGVYASPMAAKMTAATASSDTHSPSKCSDCGATKSTMSGGVCSAAFCSGFIAFLATGHVGLDSVSADRPRYDARHLAGRVNPPDPYPPRSTILS